MPAPRNSGRQPSPTAIAFRAGFLIEQSAEAQQHEVSLSEPETRDRGDSFCLVDVEASEVTALTQPEAPLVALTRTRVWDLPTRVFHWSLAIAFAIEWITQDDARYLDYHVFCGYLIGALVVFRLIWGVFGSQWARFRSFTYRPLPAVGYLRDMLRRRHAHYTGHNPAGSWAIYALLTLAAGAVISGIAALSGGKQHGPLRSVLSFAQGDTARAIHEVLAWAMLAVVVAHLLGVVASSVADRQNLALSMLSGHKHAPEGLDSVPRHAGVAAAMLIALAASAFFYFRGYLQATAERPYLPFSRAADAPALASDPAWERECGSCHLAYSPSLLPARSWTAMFAAQHEHFGEDLALDDEVVATLSKFATRDSAEQHLTAVAWQIDSRTPAATAPLRITETPYWKHRHEDLSQVDWQKTKKIDCGGCHLDAAAGTFEPGAIRVGMASGKSAEVKH